MRMQENTFDIGWQENIARQIFGTGRNVSALNLNADIAPRNLKSALVGNNPEEIQKCCEELGIVEHCSLLFLFLKMRF